MTGRNRRKNRPVRDREETQKTNAVRPRTSYGVSWTVYPILVFLAAVLYARFSSIGIKSWTLHSFYAPSVKDCDLFDNQYQNERLWGTYRPGLYFGLRMRIPSSLLMGLMWFDPSWYENINALRHLAKQEDGIRFGWTRHNGKDLAIQHLEDTDYSIDTSWIKRLDDQTGVGGDWSLRISARNSNEKTRSKQISFFFYVVDEAGPDYSSKDSMGWELHDEKIGSNSNRLLTGKHPFIGQWQLGLHSEQMERLSLSKFGAPLTSFHNLTEEVVSIVYQHLSDQYHSQEVKNLSQLVVSLPEPSVWMESSMEHPNFAVFQITGTLPFEAELVFLTGDQQSSPGRFSTLTGSQLTQKIQSRTHDFDVEFDQKFGYHMATEIEKEVRKEILSSVLGGIGYFYGSSKVKIIDKEQRVRIEDHFRTALLTATPNRSFFPRGFLWDEGFHQLIVQKWNAKLSMDILAHWLDLMNNDGWIPREQILDEEARSRVPPEFIVQDPLVGNPPTLFLPLMELLSTSNSTIFFKLAWPRLVQWFNWMVKNHENADGMDTTFRWTSRESDLKEKLNPLTLDSGLDDYPRASHPTPYERHLDLRCWILLAAEAMHQIGQRIEIPSTELQQYISLASKLKNFEDLKKLHLENDKKWFVDFGFHSENISLQKVQDENTGQKKVIRHEASSAKFQFIKHFGYVSLFPLFLHLIPASDSILEKQLRLLENPELLWTDYGLRSLSKISVFYQKHNTEHDPPYWRGAIWINMNYLAVKSLEHYAHERGPYAKHAERLFKALKSNLVKNVFKEFKRTGFLWEQYDDVTGEGKGCRPFTGWTALVLLM